MQTKECPKCKSVTIEEKMMVCWDCWFEDKEPNEAYRVCKCGVHLHGSTLANAPCRHTKEYEPIKDTLPVSQQSESYKTWEFKNVRSTSSTEDWEREWLLAYIYNRIDMALIIKNEEQFVHWSNQLREFKEGIA